MKSSVGQYEGPGVPSPIGIVEGQVCESWANNLRKDVANVMATRVRQSQSGQLWERSHSWGAVLRE